ncbi:MAG: pantoate--beta-alanine ligase [Sphingobacteriaceae bacterium]|nr:MAG: pantoate--beta-alanine ligase [Sphingobacteriaceae bacterium]
MEKFTAKIQLQQYLTQAKAGGKTVGLVPTMGALHEGHLSLIGLAQQQCDIVICSIFVNPTQFNDPRDLEKYPRPIQQDIEKLEAIGCDVLFEPAVNEIYDGHEHWHLNIGPLEHLLEGKHRPGHYQGVTQVVYKFFKLVSPDVAFFGQKDYQQFLVINQMVKLLSLPVKLQMCPIVREPDGLAMSSRNIHLSADDRQRALILSKTLNHISQNFDVNNIAQLKSEAEAAIKNESEVELSYFEIADGDTLLPADKNSKTIVALVAAKVGNTRLIDNMILRG